MSRLYQSGSEKDKNQSTIFGMKQGQKEKINMENALSRDNPQDYRLIGLPKFVRSRKVENKTLSQSWTEETATQMTMIIPTNVFKSERELKYFFEESFSAVINDLHIQCATMDIAGRNAKILAETTCDGKKSNKNK